MSFRRAAWTKTSAIAFALVALLAPKQRLEAQTSSTESVLVSAAEVPSAADVPSAYGAPGNFSQPRFSSPTDAYVLPAGEVYTDLIYECDIVHYRKPDNNFTNEIEVGLPWRFELALENNVESYGGKAQYSTFNLEARYALADWNVIPLNPRSSPNSGPASGMCCTIRARQRRAGSSGRAGSTNRRIFLIQSRRACSSRRNSSAGSTGL